MSDDEGYRRALARREDLKAQLRDVEELVHLYERLIRVPQATVVAMPGDLPRKRTRNPVPPAEIASLCRALIEARGRPMTRTELNDGLREVGVSIPGPDPAKSVGTILWRDKASFEQVRGMGYWLVGRPLPRA